MLKHHRRHHHRFVLTMKAAAFIILLCLSSMASAGLMDWITDGWMAVRNPFYRSSSGNCTLSIILHYPIQNTTFYHNTLVINTTVVDGQGNITCWFTINSGNATGNYFTCVNDTVTFPSGNITLTVHAQDSVCEVTDTSHFYMRIFFRQFDVVTSIPWILVLVVILLLIWLINNAEDEEEEPPTA